jgi:peptidoglycan hydrolase-like protein with peptidoglycan-binding domain
MGMTTQGVSDPDVTALQNRLKADGLYSTAVTGYFGPYTKSAVEAYQKKHSLSAIGVVGPSTRDLLNRGI